MKTIAWTLQALAKVFQAIEKIAWTCSAALHNAGAKIYTRQYAKRLEQLR